MLENQTQTKENTQGRSTKFKTMCGGQALIEGIMMRGPKKQAVVVRKPDGQLETQVKDLRFIKDRYPVLGLPFIRGIVNFADSMYNGVTALMYSAEFFPEDGESGAEEEDSKLEQWLENRPAPPWRCCWGRACPSDCSSCCPPCWAPSSPCLPILCWPGTWRRAC